MYVNLPPYCYLDMFSVDLTSTPRLRYMYVNNQLISVLLTI